MGAPPTNSFFWQGPGHWNVERALEALVQYSSGWHKGKFVASARAAIFTGHSNGVP
jgi:hypothetical protein